MKKDITLIGIIISLLFLFNIAHAIIWYVHPDSALNSIQAGLDSCSTDDIVLVAAGTYYENLIWPNTQGIQLTSESGLDTTTVDGGGIASVVEITTGVDSTTTIYGFTIRNGYSTHGGGIYCSNSSPIIALNTITGNTADSCGGGIYCSANSLPEIRGNTITGNIADSCGGGIYCEVNSSPTITNNIIFGNVVHASVGGGGGINCNAASPTIADNTITGNTADSCGGGIGCEVNSSPVIVDNIIFGNTAYGDGGGIGCMSKGSPSIDSCTISGNNGDGIYCEDSANPVIHYNHIKDNTDYGVQNSDANIIVNAEDNWWGNSSGPGGVGPGTGDEVSDWVDYDPWLSITDTIAPSPTYITQVEKSGSDALITWNKVTTDTLGNQTLVDYYVVYRNLLPGFIPGPVDSIGVVNHPDTTYTDGGVLVSTNSYYYLVKAVILPNLISKKSNMGYKLNKFFNEEATTTDKNWVSLPWHNAYTTVSDVTDDLSSSGDPLQKVTRLRDDQLYESWTFTTIPFPRWTGTNFSIISGSAYEMSTTRDTTLVLVGCNDPDGLVPLNENPDNTDKNWVSIPYNATYQKAPDITDEYSPTGDPLVKLTNFRDDQLYENWSFTTVPHPRWTGKKFDIERGRGYEFVTINDTTWNPTEYPNSISSPFLAGRTPLETAVEMYVGTLTEPDRAPVWSVKEDVDGPVTLKSDKHMGYLKAGLYEPIPKEKYLRSVSAEKYYREPGISHLVRAYFELDEFDNTVFTAYRPGSPFDVLTENIVGCGTVKETNYGLIWFDVGNFKKPWKDQEEVILIIEASKNGKGYFTVANFNLDKTVDIQELGKLSLVPIPAPVVSKDAMRWDDIDSENVVGYSVYYGNMRLNEKVVKQNDYSAQGDVYLRPVIRGGYETVFGSRAETQSRIDTKMPLSYTFSILPNPFSKKVRIDYALPKQTDVDMVIYDVSGRQVTSLVSSMHKPGYYSIVWDGTDRRGRNVASGTYFVAFEAGEYSTKEKILLIK